MKRVLWLVFIVLVSAQLTGCGAWQRVGGPYTRGDYSVELPEKWMRLNTRNYLLITRDGLALQNILIEKIYMSDGLTHTQKQFKKNMMAHEAAKVILDNQKADPEITHLKVLKNTPVKLNGLSGFKVVYTHKNNEGLKKKTVYYGFLQGEIFYGIRYTASARHYFKKDLKTFEKTIKSFALAKY